MDNQNKPDTLVLDLAKGGVLLVLILLLLYALVRVNNSIPDAASGLTPDRTLIPTGAPGTTQPGTALPALTPGVPALAPPLVADDGSVTFSGTGAPGSTVEIWANGELLGEVPVGEGGAWTFEASPAPGDYQVVVVTRDSDGMVVDQSAPVGVTVPAPGATATPGSGETGQPQAPSIGDATVSETGEVTISGTGEPGSTVVIYEDGIEAATAVVQDDGSFTVTYQSTSGEHVFDVQPAATEAAPEATPAATETAATPTPSAPTPTPTLIPIPPGGLVYIVQPGDGLMDLARRYYGDPARWVDIFVATNAHAYTDPSFAILTDPNFFAAGWKIFIPEG